MVIGLGLLGIGGKQGEYIGVPLFGAFPQSLQGKSQLRLVTVGFFPNEGNDGRQLRLQGVVLLPQLFQRPGKLRLLRLALVLKLRQDGGKFRPLGVGLLLDAGQRTGKVRLLRLALLLQAGKRRGKLRFLDLALLPQAGKDVLEGLPAVPDLLPENTQDLGIHRLVRHHRQATLDFAKTHQEAFLQLVLDLVQPPQQFVLEDVRIVLGGLGHLFVQLLQLFVHARAEIAEALLEPTGDIHQFGHRPARRIAQLEAFQDVETQRQVLDKTGKARQIAFLG